MTAASVVATYTSVQGDGGNVGLAVTTDGSPTAGDYLVVGLGINANADTITPPGGWLEATVSDNVVAVGGGQFRAWYLKNPAASTTYTWTVGTSTRRGIIGALVRGADGITFVDVKDSLESAFGASHAPPALTTTGADRLIIDFAFHRQFAPDVAGWTVPASGLTWTKHADIQGADSNNNIRLAIGSAAAPTAGAVSTAVWTAADVNEEALILRIAVIPGAATTVEDHFGPYAGPAPGYLSPTGWLTSFPYDATAGQAYTSSLTGSSSSSGALTRQDQKATAGASAASGALSKAAAKPIAGSSASSGSLSRLVGKALAGSTAPTGALARQVGKALAGTSASAGALVKQAAKSLAGSAASSGAIGLTRVIIRSFGGSSTPTGGLSRLVGKLLGGTSTSTGALTTSGGAADARAESTATVTAGRTSTAAVTDRRTSTSAATANRTSSGGVT